MDIQPARLGPFRNVGAWDLRSSGNVALRQNGISMRYECRAHNCWRFRRILMPRNVKGVVMAGDHRRLPGPLHGHRVRVLQDRLSPE